MEAECLGSGVGWEQSGVCLCWQWAARLQYETIAEMFSFLS